MTRTYDNGTTRGRFKRAGAPGATLIVGFDGSPCALAAIEWASQMIDTDGRLVVTGVAPPASGESQRIGGAMRALTTNPNLVHVTWTSESRQGWSAAESLVKSAHEHGAEAIVVGAHGQDPSHVFIGSVAHRLLQISDIPIIVVPRKKGERRR